ncbi:hypothetical protein KIN20_031116 [Parelaphostrongylus tenuis]|uniref:Uncharacterized protein n=1 Tax=Parelaphostrongylus tenuis TaxID=148309 RepID=A0AAD5R4Q6_PARTN|nr:hypothetical protein KIN20_031116 [Parelaphostrongylus tenuis]
MENTILPTKTSTTTACGEDVSSQTLHLNQNRPDLVSRHTIAYHFSSNVRNTID